MSSYLLWAIAGFVLIIVELMTGTFYLLVLGIAALASAAAAFFGAELWLQVIVASIVALVGIYSVQQWWKTHQKSRTASNNIDIGQSVVFEQWINEAAHTARVRYRGTQWDAKLDHVPSLQDTLYIRGQEGGMLLVGSKASH